MDAQTRALSRHDKVFNLIDRRQPGVEIGASYSPFAPKREGFKTIVVDHASTEDLKRKYAAHPVNVDAIEEVDVVLRNGKFADQIPAGSMHWVIASHVIEHTTDMIGFLQECQQVLAPGGILSLVVPDLRACFDYFRSPTTTGELLLAHERAGAVHDAGSVFDHCSRAVTHAGQITWTVDTPGLHANLALAHPFEVAKSQFENAAAGTEYIDVHRWRFVLPSFRLALLELRGLGLIDLEEACVFETAGLEFYVSLRRATPGSEVTTGEALNARRFQLLESIVAEIGRSYVIGQENGLEGQVAQLESLLAQRGGIVLHHNLHDARRRRLARILRVLDWRNRLSVTTAAPPTGPLARDEIAVRDLRTGDLLRGDAADRRLARDIPAYRLLRQIARIPLVDRRLTR